MQLVLDKNPRDSSAHGQCHHDGRAKGSSRFGEFCFMFFSNQNESTPPKRERQDMDGYHWYYGGKFDSEESIWDRILRQLCVNIIYISF